MNSVRENVADATVFEVRDKLWKVAGGSSGNGRRPEMLRTPEQRRGYLASSAG
jgi:hypothetical protein